MVASELVRSVGSKRGPRSQQRLAEASHAYERERYTDALRMGRVLAEEAPDVAAVRELLGLCLYRLQRWKPAIAELERFVELSGSVEQNPVLADCYRALRQYEKVDELWKDLSASSPSAALVAEGRIVTAGALADRARLGEAIALLERAPLATKHPKDHHLRMWYALGDLYERAGDVPRARETFRRIAAHDPEWADVVDRLGALGH